MILILAFFPLTYKLLKVLPFSDCKNFSKSGKSCDGCHNKQYDPECIIRSISGLRSFDGCICRIRTAACIVAAVIITVVTVVCFLICSYQKTSECIISRSEVRIVDSFGGAIFNTYLPCSVSTRYAALNSPSPSDFAESTLPSFALSKMRSISAGEASYFVLLIILLSFTVPSSPP